MRDPFYILMQDGYVKVYDSPGVRKFNTFGHLPQNVFDEIVMMRYYNMTEQERREAIDRVLETQFEIGADGVRKASGFPTVMERVEAKVNDWPPPAGEIVESMDDPGFTGKGSRKESEL